jgi:hypothetical protein
MLTKIKENLFYWGILIFSITLFIEHLWLGEINLTCFFKGFASGIQFIGVIFLIKRNKKRKDCSFCI